MSLYDATNQASMTPGSGYDMAAPEEGKLLDLAHSDLNPSKREGGKMVHFLAYSDLFSPKREGGKVVDYILT